MVSVQHGSSAGCSWAGSAAAAVVVLVVVVCSVHAQTGCGPGTVFDSETQLCLAEGSSNTRVRRATEGAQIAQGNGSLHLFSGQDGSIVFHVRSSERNIDVIDVADALEAVAVMQPEITNLKALNIGNRLGSLETTTSGIPSLASRITLLEDAGVSSRLDALDLAVEPIDTLQATQADLGSRIETLESAHENIDADVSGLKSLDAGNRLDALETATSGISSLASRIESLEDVDASSRLDALDTDVASLKALDAGTRLNALETATSSISSLAGRISSLEGVDASSRLDALEAMVQKMNDCAAEDALYNPVSDACVAVSALNPLDCQEIKQRGAPSGIYKVDPDGSGGREPFEVYCENSADGGGWTKVLQIKERYTPTAAAFGTIADAAVTASAKLDDRDINALLDIQGASSAYYRVTSPDESVHYYARDDDSAFIDTARAWNIFAGSRSTCMATALSSCSWCSTTYDSFDTLYDCHSSGEGLRYFEQHSGSTLRCYAHNDATKRCISRGSDHNYAQFNDIVLWVRRNPS
eukprot:m.107835 g.107835  ORF g.107835 m.107835 type:complete len:528 (-) comp9231_c0_seq2:213-1796(-)